jgi:hypothetical protein
MWAPILGFKLKTFLQKLPVQNALDYSASQSTTKKKSFNTSSITTSSFFPIFLLPSSLYFLSLFHFSLSLSFFLFSSILLLSLSHSFSPTLSFILLESYSPLVSPKFSTLAIFSLHSHNLLFAVFLSQSLSFFLFSLFFSFITSVASPSYFYFYFSTFFTHLSLQHYSFSVPSFLPSPFSLHSRIDIFIGQKALAYSVCLSVSLLICFCCRLIIVFTSIFNFNQRLEASITTLY